MTDIDLAVIGAGPAGRALAVRAAASELRVTLVDPNPDQVWTATYGMFADDAPSWLDPSVIACRSGSFTVFSPHRRVVDRGYLVLHPERLRRSLSLEDVHVVARRATVLSATTATLDDGTVLTARRVIDARGTAAAGDASLPRQTAFGIFTQSETAAGTNGGDAETVLMDWRAAGISAISPASFSYRIDTARGRLSQETCLAGRPPIPVTELERRLRLRQAGLGTADVGGTEVASPGPSSPGPSSTAPVSTEVVDFPLYVQVRPWRGEGPLRFGAVGGLMNPATGYSVALSLGAVDVIVSAMVADRSPTSELWSRRARAAYLLRLVGLAVLLALTPAQLVVFFDAFFALPVARQRAYLSSREDVRGLLGSMWAVFVRCPPRLKAAVVAATVRGTMELVRAA